MGIYHCSRHRVPANMSKMSSSSPSPERIELCTPPDSPNSETSFQFAASDTLDPLAAIWTPPKASQEVQPRRGVKRKRPDADLAEVDTDTLLVCDDSSRTISGTDVFGEFSTEPVGALGGSGDADLAVVSGDPGRTICPGASDVSTRHGMEDSDQAGHPFEHYVDAVLAECCGFFQISKTLFVVQGWDVKGQRSTVG
jgi:hypothetical protein